MSKQFNLEYIEVDGSLNAMQKIPVAFRRPQKTIIETIIIRFCKIFLTNLGKKSK